MRSRPSARLARRTGKPSTEPCAPTTGAAQTPDRLGVNESVGAGDPGPVLVGRTAPADQTEGTTGRVVGRAVQGVMAIAARGVLMRLLAFVFGVVLVRMMSPADFGVVTLGMSMIALASQAVGGIPVAAIIRQTNEPHKDELDLMFGFQLAMAALLLAAAWTAVIVAGADALPFGLMMLAVPFASIRFLGLALLERHLKYRVVVAIEAIEVAALYALAVPLVAAGGGVVGFSAALVVRAILGAFLSARFGGVPTLRPKLSPRKTLAVARVGVAFQAVQLSGAGRDYAVGLVIGSIAGLDVLGLWGVAFRLLQVPYLLFESLWRVSFPAMARLRDLGADPARSIPEVSAALGVAAALMLTPFAAVSPNVIEFLLGSEWRQASAPILWAAVGLALAGPASGAASGLLLARGEAAVVLRAVLIGAVTWVTVAAVLVPWLGVVAVGVGWLASSMAQVAVFDHRIARLTGKSLARAVLPAGGAVLAGGALGLAAATAADGLVASTVIGAAVGVLLCFAILLATNRSGLATLHGLMRRYVRPRP
jgi:O-antigen/teichoic acid export membrane protein